MVWVDGIYDMVATQERLKYGRLSGTALGSIDYVGYAEAFGAIGFAVTRPDEIGPVLRRAFDTPGPVSSPCRSVPVDYYYDRLLFEMVKGDPFH